MEKCGQNWRGKKVLVTGATGRIGRFLVAALLEQRAEVRILTRRPRPDLWEDAPLRYHLGDMTQPDRFPALLQGVQYLFHLASHQPAPGTLNPYEDPLHWKVTAEGTEHLVRAAARAGVERLIYFSSIKAVGEITGRQSGPLDEDSPARPSTCYGRAKRQAEIFVLEADDPEGMRTSVLRLPMVYGLPGRGNLPRMIQAIARHRFPPWPKLENRRTAIHVADAVAAALLVAQHPRAAGRLYFVHDGEPYSTRWLYEQICLALGRPIPRWTLPFWLLKLAALLGDIGQAISGRPMPLNREGLDKLTANAWYSMARIQRELGFVPQHCLRTELANLVQTFKAGAFSPRAGAQPPGRS